MNSGLDEECVFGQVIPPRRDVMEIRSALTSHVGALDDFESTSLL